MTENIDIETVLQKLLEPDNIMIKQVWYFLTSVKKWIKLLYIFYDNYFKYTRQLLKYFVSEKSVHGFFGVIKSSENPEVSELKSILNHLKVY